VELRTRSIDRSVSIQSACCLTSAQMWSSCRLMQQAHAIHCYCKSFCTNFSLQGYQAYASQGEQRGSPTQSQGPSSPHSLLPQGRGSIVYGPSGGYQQQDQSIYTAQGYQVSMLCPLSFCSLMSYSLKINSSTYLLTLACMLPCIYSCCLQRAQTQHCHALMPCAHAGDAAGSEGFI